LSVILDPKYIFPPLASGCPGGPIRSDFVEFEYLENRAPQR
jgi:hypothetical protein